MVVFGLGKKYAMENFPTTPSKSEIRRQARKRRAAQPNKSEVSRQILSRVMALTEFQNAATIMFYIDARDEVRTRWLLADLVTQHRPIVVPYCVEDRLDLFHIESMDELEMGAFGIFEPRRELRGLSQKMVDLAVIDLVIVPGVAFDRRGARTGHGHGYYDKLLSRTPPKTRLVGVSYECQIFDMIPSLPHDVVMDLVVTESAIYPASQAESLRHGVTE